MDEGGDTITVSGPTTGSSVEKAVVREYNGSTFLREFQRTGVTISGGNLAGSIVLQGLHASADSVALVVTVAQGTGEDKVLSPPTESGRLAVDRVSPTMTSVKTTTPTTILVTFSEPVTNPQGDNTLDWYVRGNNTLRPSAISGAGDSRLLTFQSTTFGVDEEFRFDYWQPVTRPRKYTDCVNHDLNGTTRVTAHDGIAPPVPTIIDVAGSDATDGQSWSRETAPSFRIGGLTTGYKASLWKESNGTTGLQMDGGGADVRVTEATASGPEVTVPGDQLTSDGAYTYYATAVDGVQQSDGHSHNNVSNGADSVIHHLDRVAPKMVSARTANSTVRLGFNEPIFGSNTAGDWTISSTANPDHDITGVSGTGAARILETSGVPNGAVVAYAPGSNRYEDEAGNPLADFSAIVAEGLIAASLDLEPESGSSSVGEEYPLTVTVRDDEGVLVPAERVTMRAIDGPASTRDADNDPATPVGQVGVCFTDANGQCTVSYSSTQVGSDQIQAWIGTTPAPAGDPKQDIVTVDWEVEGTDLRIDATPETSSGPINQLHVVTAVVDAVQAGTNVGGITVAGRVIAGPNTGQPLTKPSCETGLDGSCTLEYRSSGTGRDSIQLWIDSNDDGDASGELFLNMNEGQDADGAMGLADDAGQDVVFRTWTAVAIPTLQVEPDTSTQPAGTTRAFDISVWDQSNGAALGGFNVDAMIVSGPNSGRRSECVSASNGLCSMAPFSSQKEGTDIVQFWIDADGDNTANEATQLEPRAEGGINENDQDVVEIIWTPDPAASPSPSTSPTDGGHPRTASLDASSNRVGYKKPVVLQGDVVSVPECQDASVSIERRGVSGRFGVLRTVDVNDGAWSTSVRPTKNVEYRARIEATEVCAGATSDVTKVLVAARVVARGPSAVGAGECFRVRGRVLPDKAGQTVRLQERVAGRWTKLDLDSLNKRSRYRFRVCAEGGTHRFRVRFGGDARNVSSHSRPLSIQIGG